MKQYNVITAHHKGLVFYKDDKSTDYTNYDKVNLAESFQKPKKQINNNDFDIELNFVQNQLYKRLLYGLYELSPEQLSTLPLRDINTINLNCKKARKIIHIMKCKKYYYAENLLFSKIFPELNIGKYDKDWLILTVPSNVTLKSLNIKIKDIIEQFIEHKLLPKNFNEFNSETIKL